MAPPRNTAGNAGNTAGGVAPTTPGGQGAACGRAGSQGSGKGGSQARKRPTNDPADDSDDDADSFGYKYRVLSRQARIYLLFNHAPDDKDVTCFIKSIYGEDVDVDGAEFIKARNKVMDAKTQYKSKLLRQLEVSFLLHNRRCLL